MTYFLISIKRGQRVHVYITDKTISYFSDKVVSKGVI